MPKRFPKKDAFFVPKATTTPNTEAVFTMPKRKRYIDPPKYPIGFGKMGLPCQLFDFNGVTFSEPAYGPARDKFWTVSSKTDSFKDSVSVTCVRFETPNRFYLQNRKTEAELNLLIDEMTNFYNIFWEVSPNFDYRKIIVGGFFAAYWDRYDQWFRVRVMDFVFDRDGEIEYIVQLVDFGSITLVPISEIMPLKEEFLGLPMQAVWAELYDESGLYKYTEDEIKDFDNRFGGKGFDVIVFEDQIYEKELFQVVTVAVLVEPLEPLVPFKPFEQIVYNMNGRLTFAKIKY